MSSTTPHNETSLRPSRVIAEALVGRYGPCQIAARASAVGLPRNLTRTIVVACASTATDTSWTSRRTAAALCR